MTSLDDDVIGRVKEQRIRRPSRTQRAYPRGRRGRKDGEDNDEGKEDVQEDTEEDTAEDAEVSRYVA